MLEQIVHVGIQWTYVNFSFDNLLDHASWRNERTNPLGEYRFVLFPAIAQQMITNRVVAGLRVPHRPADASAKRIAQACKGAIGAHDEIDRKSTRLNSSHANISYAVFCLKKKNTDTT